MIAVFPTIVAILLGLAFEEFYAETAMPEESLFLLLLALPLCALPFLAAEALFFFARHRFQQGTPYDVRPYAKYVEKMALPVYALIVFGLGWPKVVVPLGLERTVLIDHLVVVLPYFVLLFVSLVESTRLRRRFHLSSRGPVPIRVKEALGHVSDTARQLGLVLVPLFGLILVIDVVRDTPLRLYFNQVPLLSSAFLLLTLLGLALLFPILFRVGLGLKPLVAGAPLRRRLEEMARQLGFRCRDILYWSTRRPVLNAAIVGVIPRYRYVILTEELCKRLTLDELCAVFTHEVGHGKRQHALYYLLFAIAFLTLLVPIGDAVGTQVLESTRGSIDPSLAAALGVYLPAFAFYWLVLFSALSRRFELEADVYGVESTRDPSLFILTLEKVARLGRVDRRTRAPRHFSIAGRTDFLRRAFIEREPELLEAFRRRIELIRRSIIVCSAVILTAAVLWLGVDSLRGAGYVYLELGQDERARSALNSFLTIRSGDETAGTLLAEALLYGAAPGDEAEDSWMQVLEREPSFGFRERANVLDALRTGWARAVARGRLEAANVLIARAQRINHVAAAETDGVPADAAVFDAGFDEALASMRAVVGLLEANDAQRLAELAEDPPRWLRRADVRGAFERIRAAAADVSGTAATGTSGGP